MKGGTRLMQMSHPQHVHSLLLNGPPSHSKLPQHRHIVPRGNRILPGSQKATQCILWDIPHCVIYTYSSDFPPKEQVNNSKTLYWNIQVGVLAVVSVPELHRLLLDYNSQKPLQ
ncbi:hypothetical protein XELAEV_18023799mg [Xenopus laevis]|uniref:Uncharacterized protein n=1 Tax=Xenopus laevis TaxID=8355 RepID=A0A974D4U9_XENLA|nr:hypothetical protein XELAEV_18023799mg [Xenopus laevis]